MPNFNAGAKLFAPAGNTQFGAYVVGASSDRQDYPARVLHELDATNSAALSVYSTHRQLFDNDTYVGQINGRRPGGFVYALDLASTYTSGTGSAGHALAEVGFDSRYARLRAGADQYAAKFLPTSSTTIRTRPSAWTSTPAAHASATAWPIPTASSAAAATSSPRPMSGRGRVRTST